MPLAVVVAFAVVLVIMNAVYRFSQRISHAGSFFAFVRASLGVRAGFATGWLFLAFYPVFVGLDLILFGATLNGIIVAHGGPDIPWWLLMLIGLVVIWGVAVLGIRLSVRSDLALLTFEFGVLLALALTILVKGAPGGDWHPHVFSPGASPAGFSGVVVGAVFGVLALTGFEASAYLGEEAENPRRTVPRAVLTTTVAIGVVFVFFFYVTTVGYGLANIGKLPADAAPWDTMGRAYWGQGATVLVDIASVVALIAGALAAQNGDARMLYALGRDGLLPRALGRTARRFGAGRRAHRSARGRDRDGPRIRLPAAGGVLAAEPGRNALRARRLRAGPVRPRALLLAAGPVQPAVARADPGGRGRGHRLPVPQERVPEATVPDRPRDLDLDRMAGRRNPRHGRAGDLQAQRTLGGGRDHRRGRHAPGAGALIRSNRP